MQQSNSSVFSICPKRSSQSVTSDHVWLLSLNHHHHHHRALWALGLSWAFGLETAVIDAPSWEPQNPKQGLGFGQYCICFIWKTLTFIWLYFKMVIWYQHIFPDDRVGPTKPGLIYWKWPQVHTVRLCWTPTQKFRIFCISIPEISIILLSIF